MTLQRLISLERKELNVSNTNTGVSFIQSNSEAPDKLYKEKERQGKDGLREEEKEIREKEKGERQVEKQSKGCRLGG